VTESPGIASHVDVHSLFPCQTLFENLAVIATTVSRDFKPSEFLKNVCQHVEGRGEWCGGCPKDTVFLVIPVRSRLGFFACRNGASVYLSMGIGDVPIAGLGLWAVSQTLRVPEIIDRSD